MMMVHTVPSNRKPIPVTLKILFVIHPVPDKPNACIKFGLDIGVFGPKTTSRIPMKGSSKGLFTKPNLKAATTGG